MQETEQTFIVKDPHIFKIKMLNWADQFNIFCFLDSCGYSSATAWDWVLAAGVRKSIELKDHDAFRDLDSFCQDKGWKFGHFSYDLKNQVEELDSSFTDETGFGIGFLFSPQILLQYNNGSLVIRSATKKPDVIFREINNVEITTSNPVFFSETLTTIPEKNRYLETIAHLQQHIQAGDCYEINYCRMHITKASIHPISIYLDLIEKSPAPFAALYKKEINYCISASPERYIKKEGNKIISQPIKGTAKRFPNDSIADENSRISLLNSEKERSENVMIVDLVRNDLGRVCLAGSVKVTELFGTYSFPQVHQLISTIEGELKPGTTLSDILKASFPMGSMTGAPKKKVMELINQYEPFNRGLFSGTIGYITPEGDVDFNVVIRSIFYNKSLKELHFFAGGAITINSDAAAEWEECNVKTSAIRNVLGLD